MTDLILPMIAVNPPAPIQSTHDWWTAQSLMCDASASFMLVSRLVQKSDSLNSVLDQVSETWAERVLTASTSQFPYRDFFVRNKAYAFTIFTSMNYYGATGNDGLYTSLMKHPVFTAEHNFFYLIKSFLKRSALCNLKGPGIKS